METSCSGDQDFKFEVLAEGVLDPAAKNDRTNLLINLENCNDETPYFTTGNILYFSIAEEEYNVATRVTPVMPTGGLANVTDLDSSAFKYEVIAGENANYFTVDLDTGEILTAVAEIDAETVIQFNLTVRVNDTDSPSLYVDVQCIIDVVDLNEFSPVCGSNQYVETVSEDASINTEVITVTATDADQGQTVAYSIKKQVYLDETDNSETNTSSFTIDATSGSIKVGTSLDYELGTDTSALQNRSSKCPYGRMFS